MKTTKFLLASMAFCVANAYAQDGNNAASQTNTSAAAVSADKPRAASAVNERLLPAESAVHSTGQVNIKGKVVPYKATAGTQPVWDKDGKVIASLFYTYYQRSDVTNKDKRPLVKAIQCSLMVCVIIRIRFLMLPILSILTR